MPTRTRILLVEDHAIVRQGVHALLDKEPDMQVVGEARDAAEACTRAEELEPDVIVLDIHLERSDGLTSCEQILKRRPRTKVVVLSAEIDPAIVSRALHVGVAAYVVKHDACDELTHAIRAVVADKLYLSPTIATRYLRAHSAAASPHAADGLSAQEIDLLRSIAKGLRNKEIATQLNRSVKTIEAARARLMTKLGCTSSAELIRYAVRSGIAEP